MRRTRSLALGAILLVSLGATLFVLRRPTGPTLIAVGATPLRCAGAEDTIGFVALGAITVGADGALWFTEPLDRKIGRLTVTGQYTDYCVPRGQLSFWGGNLVTGPDGALWFVLNHGALGRITLRGATSRSWPLSDPGHFYSGYLIVGPDHAFWLVGSGDIVRIPPPLNASNAPAPRPLSGTRFPLGPPRFPHASVTADASVVVGPDGALWFAGSGYKSKSINDNDRGFIGRLAPSGATRLYDIPFGRRPRGMVVGPDKALWFTTRDLNGDGGGGHIGRLTLTGKMSDYALPPLPPGSHGPLKPTDLIVGSDGLLWFVMPGYLGRVDRAGHTTYTPIPADNFFDSYPFGPQSTVVRGPDGALWATEDGGKIARVTADGTTTQYVLTPPPLPHS